MPAVTDGKRNAASYTGSGDADNLQTVNFTGPALIKVVMRGMAQIMLQENAVTGFLFLAGIFYGSLYMGFAALAAVVAGTLTARVAKLDISSINKGIYGFSPALTGVALSLFFKSHPITWGCIVAGGVIAALLQHFFLKRNVPVFTFPFVLTTWIFVLLISHFFPGLSNEPVQGTASVFNYFSFAVRGFGQVIFQNSFVSGILFLVAVFISSPVAALFGLAGAVLGGLFAFAFTPDVESIAAGLFSFNAVLAAIVFARDKLSDGAWMVFSVVLCTAISLLFFKFALIQLTFPFVAAAFLTLTIRGILKKSKSTRQKILKINRLITKTLL